MNNLKDGKILIVISLIISQYFLTLYLLFYFKADHFLIGFFTELLTIPFLLAQIIFLIIGIRLLISKNSKNPLIILSVVILSISTILTIGSFFF